MVEGRLVNRLEDKSRWVNEVEREVKLPGDMEIKPEDESST